jgi:putative adhesin
MFTRRCAIAAFVLLAAWSFGRGEARSNRPEVEAVQEWTLERQGADGLRLRTRGGNIEVVGDGGDRLQIRAVKKARAADDTDARAFLDEMRIERRRDGDQWVVEANWPDLKPRHLQSASVSFQVHVPRGMRLDTQTGGGNLDVRGAGDSRLRTGGGNVQLRDLSGGAEVHTGGGNVGVDGCAGTLALETGGGNVDIRGARRSVKAHTGGGNIDVNGGDGPVEVQTGGGNIGIERAASPVKATTGGGNIEVNVARADGPVQVELGTGSGNVTLRLPENASAQLLAQTGSGQVLMEPPTNARFNKDHSRVEATLGDGRGAVRVRTGSGGIHVRLASR